MRHPASIPSTKRASSSAARRHKPRAVARTRNRAAWLALPGREPGAVLWMYGRAPFPSERRLKERRDESPARRTDPARRDSLTDSAAYGAAGLAAGDASAGLAMPPGAASVEAEASGAAEEDGSSDLLQAAAAKNIEIRSRTR